MAFGGEKSLALAMVRPEHAAPGTELEMTILGTRHPVTVIPESPYDPENARLRS
jgi:dimethylglycine dehydrogenase